MYSMRNLLKYDERLLSDGIGVIISVIGLYCLFFTDLMVYISYSKVRIVGDVIKYVMVYSFATFLFRPNRNETITAIIVGITASVEDFFLETYAYIVNWWYAVGGTTIEPIIIIPLEMLFSFFPLCFLMCLTWIWADKHINSKKYLYTFYGIFMIIAGIIGTYGDWVVASGAGFWIAGTCTPIETFFVWVGCILVLIIEYEYLKKRGYSKYIQAELV